MDNLPVLVFIVIIALVAIGFYGLLVIRNLIKVIVALQIMVKGGILAMILAGRLSGQMAVGESMALTVIVADTIVAVVGLALAVQVKRHIGTLNIRYLTTLKK